MAFFFLLGCRSDEVEKNLIKETGAASRLQSPRGKFLESCGEALVLNGEG